MATRARDNKSRRPIPSRALKLLPLAVVVAAAALICCSPSNDSANYATCARNHHVPVIPVELIIVPESEEWLLPIAAALSAKLRSEAGFPALLALSDAETNGTASLLERLAPARSLGISSSAEALPAHAVECLSAEIVEVGADHELAAIRLALRFWEETDVVVVAAEDDPGAVIVGSALAANVTVPFIPLCSTRAWKKVSRALEPLGVSRVIMVVVDRPAPDSWIAALEAGGEILDMDALQERIIRILRADRVRNVVLTRIPHGDEGQPKSSWLAPYLSLVRGSPIVLCRSQDPRTAEARVAALLADRGLSPRSVTILADYDSIGTITARDLANPGGYEVDIEPCSGPPGDGACALGVGRIPCKRLHETSLLIARGILRERLLKETPARLLMVGNPGAEYAPLPLCETISRITAGEFENFGVWVDDFYGRPADDPVTAAAAAEANLVIYEGHIYDQRLFESPPTYQHWEVSGVELVEDRELETGANICEIESEPQYVAGGESLNTLPEAHEVEAAAADQQVSSVETPAVWASVEAEASLEEPHQPVRGLRGLPIVVLQSCNSLEEEVARLIFEAGGVGLVGSVTGIHSASGSAFVKAFSNGLLYRGDTVGEALRDARNYFLCLSELKARRGHKEQAKAYRVAMSFRLWGDPEVKAFPHPLAGPRLPPVSAEFVAQDSICISTPERRLLHSWTNKYFTSVFPGCELAGIVKRMKNKSERKLMPVYFFRLPIPAGLTGKDVKLRGAGDTSPRAVFKADPYGRFVYVLYFPDKDTRNAERILLPGKEPDS